MLGGGIFTAQNKVLAGTYINFVSSTKATAALSDRGVVAMPLQLDWGIDEAVFSVSAEDFAKNSLSIFGYEYGADQLKPLRELFRSCKQGHFYKLNAGAAAANTFCKAKHKGTRGNDLKTIIAVNADDNSKMDVSTYLGTVLVDKQTVLPNTDHLAANDFLIWNANVALTETAGLNLTNGDNGLAVTGAEYQNFLDKIESYSFNILGCPSSTTTIADLFVSFTKRMRNDIGMKFQTVVYRSTANDEGIINLWNHVTDDSNLAAAVYWVSGVSASCEVNKSNTNKLYDGEYTINVSLKQSELEALIKQGKFAFHKVGNETRVLDDINSFTSFTGEKTSDFSSNQTIRVLDQIAIDRAIIFNTKYLGAVPNDASGRISLWNDYVRHAQELQKIRAIEDFKPEDIEISKGTTKKAVIVTDKITPTNAMTQLYITTMVQ